MSFQHAVKHRPAAPEGAVAPPVETDPLGADPLGGDALGFDPLATDPMFANRIDGFGDGRRGQFGDPANYNYNSNRVEIGGKKEKGLTGSKTLVAKTTVENGEKKTSTEQSTKSLFGSTREKIEAQSGKDGKAVHRDKTSTGLFGGKTNTESTAIENQDGTKSVHGKTTTTKKDGTTTEKALDAKGKKANEAKDAEQEAGTGKAMGKGKAAGLASKIGKAVKFGGVGDESGIDLDDFTQDREEIASFADAQAGVTEIEGGHVAKASANLGPRVSGNVLTTGVDTDAFGNERKSTAGATGEAHAGGSFEAGAQHKRTESGAEVGAKAGGKIGVGGSGAAGATTETALADKLAAKAGAQVKGDGFVGGKASGGVTASHGKANASVAAQGQAMVGAEAGGKAGINASINGAGFDLVGARAQVEGRGMVGAEVKASGKAEAHAIKGLSAGGQAEAFVGAKAEGEAKGGVSLGGVDGDVVAAGQAKASADASAQGNANVGLLGASAEGGVEAFAGAKAGGEARFELGAGGLNLGLIGVRGEVSAGAGAVASGKLNVSLQKVGLAGRAGVTWGVGAGAGGMFQIDPSFPVRLTLNKLVENNVIPTSDIPDLIGSATSLVYTPVLGQATPAVAPAADVAGPMIDHLPGPVDEAAGPALGGPDKRMTLDALMAIATPEQREALEETKAAVESGMGEASKGILGKVHATMDAGRGLYGDLLALLARAFTASQDALQAAREGMSNLVFTAIEEAKGVSAEFSALGATLVGEIHRFVAADPKTLLDGSWEKTIDAGVERVRALSEAVRARIAAIIERTRAAVAAVADKAIEAAVAPIHSLAGSLGGVVGTFGGKVSALGLGMITGLREVLAPTEKGVKVRGMNGVLTLPVSASPALDIAEKPVKEFGSFGQRSIGEGIATALNFITDGLRGVLGTESGGILGGLASAAQWISGVLLDAPVKLAEGAAAIVKPIVRGAIAIFQAAQRAAQAIAAAARKVGSWFLGLFGL